jgi:bifunctional non-homologous end joining protein LigD
LALPILSPAELIRLPSPFDDDRFIFELKHDGFRALAYLTPNGCHLVSRRGNVYKSFRSLCDSLSTLRCSAVLDGEIVTLDETGRPKFYDLLRRRGDPVFYAFDCLWHDGKDLRSVPLLRRKQKLERIVRTHPSVLLAQHVESLGCQLFNIVRERDLEGIVAKRKDAAYGVDWFKVRNAEYSQYEGRRELFEKRSSRVS